MADNSILPLGSVVLLHNGSKRLMVYGRYQKQPDTNKVFHYAGCLYPEGNLDSKHCFLFNNDDIEQVIFKGFSDAEDITYVNNVENLLKQAQG